jgi:hypothetical protein
MEKMRSLDMGKEVMKVFWPDNEHRLWSKMSCSAHQAPISSLLEKEAQPWETRYTYKCDLCGTSHHICINTKTVKSFLNFILYSI